MMLKKRRFALLMILCIVAVIFFQIVPNAAKVNEKRFIVKFEQGIPSDKQDQVFKKHSAKKIKTLKYTDATVVLASADNSLLYEEGVISVEEDYPVSVNEAKKKAKAATLDQPEQMIPWGVDYMRSIVGETNTPHNKLRIAIIDTGIDTDHPDLERNISGGYNATSNRKSFEDTNGHGTHVAGIIAGVDNDIGVIGLFPEVNLFAVKALDENGNGYSSDIIESIEWCIHNDIDVINMSFSLQKNSQLLHEAVIWAKSEGITMVAAAGNTFGGNSEYPAAYDEVIGVGAIDINGNITSFSAVNEVDVWAPGLDIYSTTMNDGYAEFDGTSMAAPHFIFSLVNRVD